LKNGLMQREGSIVDATIIVATISSKRGCDQPQIAVDCFFELKSNSAGKSIY
jgi:hypothetical protein